MKLSELRQYEGLGVYRVQLPSDRRYNSKHRRLRSSAREKLSRWATSAESIALGCQIEMAYQASENSPEEFAARGGIKFVYLYRLRNGQFPEVTPLIREACHFWNKYLPDAFQIHIPEHLQGPGNKVCH